MGGQRGSRRNFAPKVEGWQGARRASSAAAPAPHGMTFLAARTKAAARAAPLRTRRGGVGARRRRARPGGAAPRAEESGHSRAALRRRPVAPRWLQRGGGLRAGGGEGPELGAERGPGRFRALRPGGPRTRNAARVGGPPGAARGRVAAPSPADRRPECGRKRLARGAPARGPQPLPERRKEPARGAEIRSRSSLINFLFNVTGPHCGRGNTSPRP